MNVADEHVETNKQRKQAMRNPQSLSFKLWSFPHGYCTNQLVLPGILEKYYLFKNNLYSECCTKRSKNSIKTR